MFCHALQEILTASASSHEQVIPAQVPLSFVINLSWAGGQSFVSFISLTDVTGVCMNTIHVHESISSISRNVQIKMQVASFQTDGYYSEVSWDLWGCHSTLEALEKLTHNPSG